MTNQTSDEQRLIGIATSFSEVLQQVSRVAPLNRPVLVVGERGTGKELIAARLHYLSERWQSSYHKLNCAAIADNLIESELFGHEAGAFTGAARRHAGRFERAHKGSLFLDELATTSSRVQEQLLRIIEYGEFERVGGTETIRCDVRLIAATNEDLPSLAQANKFRHDLLDRLSFDVITLPPLRHRQDDILVLAEHFATAMCHELGREFFAGFNDEVQVQLLNYQWPGNVRELKNVIERSVYRQENAEQTLSNIVFDAFDSPNRPQTRETTKTKQTSHAAHITQPPEQLPRDLKAWMAAQEQQWIKQALTQEHNNQRRAAERLGLSYHQLRASLRKYPELLTKSSA